MDINHPQPIPIFSKTSGLNNRVNSIELADDELAECHNLLIDEFGYLHKRPGYTLQVPGLFHSLPQEKEVPYVAKDRTVEQDCAIYYIASDLTVTGVRSGLTQCAHISFASYAGRVYYMNGFEKGFLIGDRSFPWVLGSTEGMDLDTYTDPPIGNHITMYNGRMLIAVGPVLYFSELYRPDLYRPQRCFVKFAEDIVMVRPVEDGIFISTTSSIYFIKGEVSDIIVPKLVSTSPALEWSDVSDYVDASKFGDGFKDSTLCAVWVGTDGVNWGLPGGHVVKVNDHKIKYPDSATKGASLLYGRSFIHSIT